MRIVQRGKKWVLYGDDGKIIVMSSDRTICEKDDERMSVTLSGWYEVDDGLNPIDEEGENLNEIVVRLIDEDPDFRSYRYGIGADL